MKRRGWKWLALLVCAALVFAGVSGVGEIGLTAYAEESGPGGEGSSRDNADTGEEEAEAESSEEETEYVSTSGSYTVSVSSEYASGITLSTSGTSSWQTVLDNRDDGYDYALSFVLNVSLTGLTGSSAQVTLSGSGITQYLGQSSSGDLILFTFSGSSASELSKTTDSSAGTITVSIGSSACIGGAVRTESAAEEEETESATAVSETAAAAAVSESSSTETVTESSDAVSVSESGDGTDSAGSDDSSTEGNNDSDDSDGDNSEEGGNGSDGDNSEEGGNGSDGDNSEEGGNGSDGDSTEEGGNGSDGDSSEEGGNGSDTDNSEEGGNGSDTDSTEEGGNGSDTDSSEGGGNGSDTDSSEGGGNGSDTDNSGEGSGSTGTYSEGGVSYTVTISGGNVSEVTSVSVEPVKSRTKFKALQKKLDALDDGYDYELALALDVTLWKNNEEFEPNSPVEITLSGSGFQKIAEEIKSGNMVLFHFTDNGAVEKIQVLEVNTEKGIIRIKMNSFSYIGAATRTAADDDDDDTEETTSNNNTYGAIAIMLVDADTGDYLEGGVFRLYTVEGEYLNTYTTDENGWLCTYPVWYGAYSLIMVTAPEGYELDDTPIRVALTSTLSYSPDYPWTIRVELTKSGTLTEVSAQTTDTSGTAVTTSADSSGTSSGSSSSSSGSGSSSSGSSSSSSSTSSRSSVAGATGDDGNVLLWLILMAMSGAGLAVMFLTRRREEG